MMGVETRMVNSKNEARFSVKKTEKEILGNGCVFALARPWLYVASFPIQHSRSGSLSACQSSAVTARVTTETEKLGKCHGIL